MIHFCWRTSDNCNVKRYSLAEDAVRGLLHASLYFGRLSSRSGLLLRIQPARCTRINTWPCGEHCKEGRGGLPPSNYNMDMIRIPKGSTAVILICQLCNQLKIASQSAGLIRAEFKLALCWVFFFLFFFSALRGRRWARGVNQNDVALRSSLSCMRSNEHPLRQQGKRWVIVKIYHSVSVYNVEWKSWTCWC